MGQIEGLCHEKGEHLDSLTAFASNQPHMSELEYLRAVVVELEWEPQRKLMTPQLQEHLHPSRKAQMLSVQNL